MINVSSFSHGLNEYGLESAKPDLQSMFKKPVHATAGRGTWERVRDGLGRR
jgi:hypothetical protein